MSYYIRKSSKMVAYRRKRGFVLAHTLELITETAKLGGEGERR